MADLKRWAAALAVVAAAGCAGMPTRGALHVGRALPAAGGLSDVDVRALPPSWHVGLSPHDVVAGFLRALVSDDDDYSIARSYLTGGASSSWRPHAGVTTYEDDALRLTQGGGSGASRTIVVSGRRIGEIDGRGDYSPANAALRASYGVVRQNQGWRLNRVPDGLLLSALDVPRFFRTADIYYLNPAGTSLVPEQVLVQNSTRGAATALVTLLLSGPGHGIAPAAHTAAPAGTTLVGNVPVDAAGVADVNVSAGLRLASRGTVAAFSAQLVWTLRQVSGVTAVRLLVEGAPVPVAGVTRQPIDSWSRFDPAPPPTSAALMWVSAARLHGSRDGELLARSDPGHVVSLARSANGRTLAVVEGADNGRMRLLVGGLGARLEQRVSAVTITTPTFDGAGDVVAVVTGAAGRRVVAVTPSGAVHDVATDSSVLGTAVTDLRISRDGAHVAAVDGAGRLLVGLVDTTHGQIALHDFRAIVPGLVGVSGAAWAGADSLVVTASGPGGSRQVVETDSDGYSVRTVATDGIRGSVVTVAAAPGLPLVVGTSGGALWTDTGDWHRSAAGRGPVYSG